MAMKPRTFIGTPHTYARVNNSSGFNPQTLGRDTVPGPIEGAPLYSSRTVDDGTMKRTVYPDGINPYGMTPSRGGPVIGVDKSAPGNDTPVRAGGEQPNRHGKSKAQEVARNDPSEGLGVPMDRVLFR